VTGTDTDQVESGQKHSRLKALRETVLLLAFAIILALVVKTFFVQSFYIPSESMEPGLIINDRILVEKPSYWGSDGPERGDVIVFDDPGGWLNGLEEGQPMSLAGTW
jgi:signal peptidase I